MRTQERQSRSARRLSYPCQVGSGAELHSGQKPDFSGKARPFCTGKGTSPPLAAEVHRHESLTVESDQALGGEVYNATSILLSEKLIVPGSGNLSLLRAVEVLEFIDSDEVRLMPHKLAEGASEAL